MVGDHVLQNVGQLFFTILLRERTYDVCGYRFRSPLTDRQLDTLQLLGRQRDRDLGRSHTRIIPAHSRRGKRSWWRSAPPASEVPVSLPAAEGRRRPTAKLARHLTPLRERATRGRCVPRLIH